MIYIAELKQAANDLNTILGLEPKIDPDAKKRFLMKDLVEAIKEVHPLDELQPNTKKVMYSLEAYFPILKYSKYKQREKKIITSFHKTENYILYNDDCIDVMRQIPDNSIDMILTGLPYGITGLGWDTIIPFELMWEQIERITKSNSAILLFGQGIFSGKLQVSNEKMFKYTIVWDKGKGSNFLRVNKTPFYSSKEDINIFYKKQPTYNPQMKKGEPYYTEKGYVGQVYGSTTKKIPTINYGTRYPLGIITDIPRLHSTKTYHPTQKPVPLMEYLIKTYSNKTDVVLDFTMGSGTVGLACKNLNRKFIGVDNGVYRSEKGKEKTVSGVELKGLSWCSIVYQRLEEIIIME